MKTDATKEKGVSERARSKTGSFDTREEYHNFVRGADDLYCLCEDRYDHDDPENGNGQVRSNIRMDNPEWESDELVNLRLVGAKEKSNIPRINYPEEMARTEPLQEICGDCDKISDQCANYPAQDNRMDLYRLFAIIPSDLGGVSIFFCKKCLKSTCSGETLYRIYNPMIKKTRMSFVAEWVRCISCGRSWHREEKEQLLENLSDDTSNISTEPLKCKCSESKSKRKFELAKPCEPCSKQEERP